MLLPIGLVVAIAAGTVASGALGMLFLHLAGSSEVAFVDGPSITISTDSPRYDLGEPIAITVTNSGTTPLLATDAYGLEIRGLDTVLIYSMPPVREVVLDPGQEADIVWDQTRDDGTAVLQGVYKLHIDAITPDGIIIDDDISIQILR